MTCKPILFNTPMTRAILDGRKSETRRVIKPQPLENANMMYCFAGSLSKDIGRWHDTQNDARFTPPCAGDDILWVRETWCPCEKYFGESEKGVFYYKADATKESEECRKQYGIPWHPSIFMPREAARLFLRVTSVRPERLLDMTVDDAIAEGINTKGIITSEGPIEYLIWDEMRELWTSTIKPVDREQYGWQANPWVWGIEFERCEEPEGWLI